MAYSLRHKPTLSSLPILLLLFWIFYGFIYILDSNTQTGCIDGNNVYSFHNIFLSFFSIALLSFGYYYKNEEMGKWLVGAESAFWVLKLFFLKGGYAVGITASLPIDIVIYDFLALTLRLILINQFFAFSFKSIYILITAFLLMVIKVQFFR